MNLVELKFAEFCRSTVATPDQFAFLLDIWKSSLTFITKIIILVIRFYRKCMLNRLLIDEIFILPFGE